MSTNQLLRKLPPLKSLVYFEASARLCSFTKASQELNVTQGAVSRQIRQLEDFLGRSLFARENRQVALTDDGHNYYVSIAHILAQLVDATDSLLAPILPNQVTVVTSSALASMYLLPRIPAFRQQFDDIQIRIVAREHLEGLGNSEYNLALFYNRELPAVDNVIELFGEQVFPVCSPSYLKINNRQFSSKEFIPDNLIWLETNEDWVNWPEWLEAIKVKIPLSTNRLMVNNYSMVVQAAIGGQGVALAWPQLVNNELEQGLLVRCGNWSLETNGRFYLIQSPAKLDSKPTNVFRSWLLENV